MILVSGCECDVWFLLFCFCFACVGFLGLIAWRLCLCWCLFVVFWCVALPDLVFPVAVVVCCLLRCGCGCALRLAGLWPVVSGCRFGLSFYDFMLLAFC